MPPLPPRTRLSLALAIAVPLMLGSCGGGGGGGGFSFVPFPPANGGGGDAPPPPPPPPPPPAQPPDAPKFTVGGTVTGLAGSGLVLQNNAGDDLAVGADGSFSFATSLDDGADYGVTVKTQPAALQVCVAHQAFGKVAAAPVASVAVRCSSPGAERYGFSAQERAPDREVTMFKVADDGGLKAVASFTSGGTPQHVTVHPLKPYVYLSNISGSPGGVTQYTIVPETGSTPATLNQRRDIASPSAVFTGIASTGLHAYVIGSGMLQRFDVDAGTGELTGVTATVPGGGRKFGLDPAGRFVFVVNGSTISSYRLDPVTGEPLSPPTTVATPAAGGFTDVVLEPTGRFAYANGGINPSTLGAYAIDAVTGALTPIGSAPGGNAPFGMAVDPSGRFLYAANRDSHNVSAYAIDPRTGTLTPVPGQPFAVGANTPNSVTVDRTGRFAYTANQGDSTISIFTIDRTTGALALKTAHAVGANGPQFFALWK